MSNVENVGEVTRLFVEHFIKLAELTKDSPVTFGTLFIGFMLASKVVGMTLVKMGAITQERIRSASTELDEKLDEIFKDEISDLTNVIKGKESDNVGSGSPESE